MSKTLKKTLSIIIAILMIATTMPFAFAADSGTCGDNVTWTLDSDGVLTISGTGAMKDYDYGISPFYNNSDITTVVIKDGVTGIGEYAFSECRNLESVTIPDSVTSIGSYAFHYTACYNDENNWENGVLYIGNHLIAAEYDISGNYSVKSGTKTIAGDAFADRTSLESIEIPDSVTSIGNYAFCNCTSLESITIGDGVTSIGDYAFAWCESLASIEIPDSVTSIGEAAFESCTSLASITIGDSVTSIGDYAFNYCTKLESITIGDSVTSIGDYAFNYCTKLESITVDEDNESYSSENGVLFNKDKTTLILYPAGKSTSYTIPNSVTSIGEYAFFGCTSLVSIEIPDGVTSIGNQTFYGCTSLASIEIPDSVTSIGDWAFYNCTSLTLVHYLGTSEQWDKIEIDLFNEALTGATKHYCTQKEKAINATCTEEGKTAVWYCSDCNEDIGGETIKALGHVDANGDYKCDNGCGHEFEKPATDNVCEDCGKVHTNFFSEIICFFTRIINYIKNLFA